MSKPDLVGYCETCRFVVVWADGNLGGLNSIANDARSRRLTVDYLPRETIRNMPQERDKRCPECAKRPVQGLH